MVTQGTRRTRSSVFLGDQDGSSTRSMCSRRCHLAAGRHQAHRRRMTSQGRHGGQLAPLQKLLGFAGCVTPLRRGFGLALGRVVTSTSLNT